MDDFDQIFGKPVKEQKQQVDLFEETEPKQAARIRAGNIKLWERWHLIQIMKEGSGKEEYLKGWDEGKARLLVLCRELVNLGWRKCLYKKEKPKYLCLACPVAKIDPEKCPAWGIW